MLNKTLFVFAALLAFSAATDWKPCKKSGTATLNKVKVTNCEKLPCVFDKMKKLDVFAYLIPGKNVNELEATVTANVDNSCKIKGVHSSKVCKYVAKEQGENLADAECPLAKGQEYVIPDKIAYNKCDAYINKEIELTYEIKDKNTGETCACFEITGKISK